MIYIIHGENEPKAREQILTLQKKHSANSKAEVELVSINPVQLKEILSSVGMFDTGTFVVANIDGLHYTKYQAYVDELINLSQNFVLILVSKKELSPSNAFIKNASKLNAHTIVLPALISSSVFGFLDNLFTLNREGTYKELKKLQQDGQDDFYTFSMILYGLRNVANAKFESPSFNKAAPFVKSKSSSQAKNFSGSKIKNLFSTMYSIDKDVKTGSLSQEIFVPLAIEKILEKSNT